VPETITGILLDDWEAMHDPPDGRLELIEGATIMSASPRIIHQEVARALANRFDQLAAPDLKAVLDVEWRHLAADGEVVISALRPDVTVSRRSDLRGALYISAPPVLAVEVLSTGDASASIAKRSGIYLSNGLRCYVEVAIDDAESQVRITWSIASGGRWRLVAVAAGDEELRADVPFTFTVIPNSLLPL